MTGQSPPYARYLSADRPLSYGIVPDLSLCMSVYEEVPCIFYKYCSVDELLHSSVLIGVLTTIPYGEVHPRVSPALLSPGSKPNGGKQQMRGRS